LVERLVYTEDVGSSSLSSPTTFLTLRGLRIFEIGESPEMGAKPSLSGYGLHRHR
jgi:hypothetical protein